MPGPVAAAYFYEELMKKKDDGSDSSNPKVRVCISHCELNHHRLIQSVSLPLSTFPLKLTIVAAHENQVFRANGFRNALQKLSGSEDNDIRV